MRPTKRNPETVLGLHLIGSEGRILLDRLTPSHLRTLQAAEGIESANERPRSALALQLRELRGAIADRDATVTRVVQQSATVMDACARVRRELLVLCDLLAKTDVAALERMAQAA